MTTPTPYTAEVDYELLDQQYHLLIDLLELTRDDDAFMDVSPLDGIVSMLGDMLDQAGIHTTHDEYCGRSVVLDA